MNCVFCKIIDKDIPSYTIYEDDIVKIFLDINPKSKGHTLIIPKKHTLDITTIDDRTISYIMDKASLYTRILMEKLNADGITLIQNNGAPQEVKHFHLHLIPHYSEESNPVNPKEIFDILKSN